MIEAFMKMEIKSRWVIGLGAALVLAHGGAFAATDDLSTTLSKGLFEEEANHNLPAAIRTYQSVIDRFDTDRKLAATAIFRLGECYRKQGSTNEANAQYQRILREFADQAPVVALSRQNLAATGITQAALAPVEKVTEYNQTCALLERQRKRLKELLVQFTPSSSFVKDIQTQINESQQHKEQLEASYPGLIGTNPDRNDSEKSANGSDTSETTRVEAIIRYSPDLINAPDQNGETLLQSHAAHGDLDTIRLLLDHGAAVNGTKQPGLTPLAYAAGNGHKAAVDLLLSKGAKPALATESGVTPLHLAVLKGYELVAKDLIEAGAPIDAQVSKTVNYGVFNLSYRLEPGQTPLQIACQQGYRSLADLLISKGADVNSPTSSPPLYFAVISQDQGLAKALLAARADPNAGAAAALKAAAGIGDVSMLDLLLAHASHPDLNGCLEAAISRKQPATVKELIGRKADPNGKVPAGLPASPYPGGTPFIFLALSDLPTLTAVLDGGANPNVREPAGDSPLERAMRIGANSEQALELLLAHGADPNEVDPRNGFTVLHRAAADGYLGVMKLLLKHGAKVDVRSNSTGVTPLHLAVQSGRQEVVALLLDAGADPNIRDQSGETPLDLAKRFNAPVPVKFLADLLRQHGASDDLPNFDRIEVRRFPNYISTIFSRATNELNRYSLLELLAVHYGFVSAALSSNPGPQYGNGYSGLSHTIASSLSFPNLDKIEIRRPNADGKGWSRIAVSAESILQNGDCSKDVWLQWGDQVEIPEADHPLDEPWRGFSVTVFTNLQNCVTRHVEFIIKGEGTNLIMKPAWPMPRRTPAFRDPPPFDYVPPRFCIVPALDSSGLLRTSSDLSHVKVRRHNPATGEDWERVFDCSGSVPLPNLWLRDGDVVDVPDKP